MFVLLIIISFNIISIAMALSSYFTAKALGIHTRKFYIWFDYGFSLYKFNYKGTEFGIGWLPLGVDLRFSQSFPAEDPTSQSYNSLSPYKKLLLNLSGPIFGLIVGIAIYANYTSDFRILSKLIFSIIVTLAISGILLHVTSLIYKKFILKHLPVIAEKSLIIFITFIYIHFYTFIIIICVLEIFPFVDLFTNILSGEYASLYFTNTYSSKIFVLMITFVSIFIYLIMVTPFLGRNSFFIIELLYTIITGKKFSQKILERGSLFFSTITWVVFLGIFINLIVNYLKT